VARKAPQLARIHAIWGLGQIGRKDAKAIEPVQALLNDDDAEIRAQAWKVLGDLKVPAAPDAFTAIAKDTPRVRFFAAQAAGKTHSRAAVPALLDMLRANKDADPYLRHAGVMALAGIGDKQAIKQAGTDPSSSVRLASLLAMRRLGMPEAA